MDFVYIKVFIDTLDALEPLNDTERGRLFTALLQYAKTGKIPELSGNERFLFPMLRAQIDRDAAQIDDLSKTRSESGKKGGRPKKQKNQMLSEKPNAKKESKKSIDNRQQNIDNRIQTIDNRQQNTEYRQESTPSDDGVSISKTMADPKAVYERHGEFGWVLLTSQAYQKLINDLGKAEAERCIAYVDELAQQSGNKNKWKDWNLVVRKVSREGWGIGRQIANRQPAPQKETSYDLDEIERMISNPGGKFG